MTTKNDRHHNLCLLAAHWLNKKENKGFNDPTCHYVAVEVNSVGNRCIADVFGWGDGLGKGYAGVQVEVKMSHGDFLRDKKKRHNGAPGLDVGCLKYYCCPAEVINLEELREDFGLLYEHYGLIEVVRSASFRTDKEPSLEIPLIASVMRRLGVKPGVFEFRKQNHENNRENTGCELKTKAIY